MRVGGWVGTGRRGSVAALAILDQAVSSIGNVVPTILVARAVSGTEFGKYVLLLAIYQILLLGEQSLGGEPLLVLAGRATARAKRSHMNGVCGFALSVGLSAFIVIEVLSLLVAVSSELRVLGVLLPGLLVQDALRYLAFAERRQGIALGSDTCWIIVQTIATIAVLRSDEPAVGLLIFAWGAPSYLAALFAAVALRAWPDIGRVRQWLRFSRHLGTRIMIESGGSNAAFQLGFFMTSGLAGVAAGGNLRLAHTLFGPLHVAILGARTFGVPELSSRLGNGKACGSIVAATAATLGLVAAAGTMVLTLLPDALGRNLLGPPWTQLGPLLLLVGIHKTLEAVGVGPYLFHRVRERATWTLRVRLTATAISLVATLVLVPFFGAEGGAAAAIVGSIVASGAWWSRYSRDRTVDVGRHRSPARRRKYPPPVVLAERSEG